MVAQTAPAAAEAAAAQAATLGEVVVTARRRSEDLEKVPVAITAFSEQTLKQHAVSTIYDLATIVPGLATQSDSGSSNQPLFSIRGRGQEYGGAAGSVETYFAEVPLSPPAEMPSLPAPFFDLSSVQVLKGPQGTLFGRSTTGGAVLFVPQAPTDQYGGYLRLQGGDYSDFQAEGALNLPLAGDKASLRIAGFDWQRSGYSRTLGGATDPYTGAVLPSQRFDNQDVKEARATLRLRPVEGLENSTIFEYHSDSNRGSAISTLEREGAGAVVDPTFARYGARVDNVDIPLGRPSSDIWALINTTSYKLTPHLTLRNIFGYIDSTAYAREPNDLDGTPYPVVDVLLVPGSHPAVNHQYTDEVQFQGDNFNGKLTWIGGGLIDLEREPKNSFINNDGEFLPGVGVVVDSTFTQTESDSYSAFASGTYHVDDKLSLTAGVRSIWYNTDLNSYEQISPVPTPGTVVPQTPGPEAVHVTPSSFSHGFAYDVGATYNATADAMVYGGYRRGWKPGGENAKAPPGESAFQRETVDDFYLGLKTTFRVVGRPARFNIEGYYDLYHEAQRSTLSFIPQFGTLAIVVYNAPAVTYRGTDLDFQVDAADWLTLSGNYSYIDAFNTNFPNTADQGLPGQTTQSLTDNPVAFVSHNKFAFTARLHYQLPDDRGELALAPTVTYQDRSYTVEDGLRLSNAEVAAFGAYCLVCVGGATIPQYTLVNLRVEWNKILGSNVDLAANATNLTNKTFITGTPEILAFFSNGVSFGPPRMFSVEATVRF